MFIFESWFHEQFLPRVRDLPGKKLLIGDNLSSHLSVEVINTCRKENIAFVCLPPNSTDKMQPLDVGFFAPLKGAWKKQLRNHLDDDPTAKMLAKPSFPKMLKEVMKAVNSEEDPLTSPHLPNAFEKCGLWPINRQKVLERIPSVVASEEVARHLDKALLQKLEVRRFGNKKKMPRGKKVPAGQSLSAEDSSEELTEEEETTDSDERMMMMPKRKRKVPRKESRKRNKEVPVESSEDEGGESEKEVVQQDVGEEEDSNKEHEEEDDNEEREEEDDNEELPDILPTRKSGSFVVALYEGQWFLAEVCRDQDDIAAGYTRLNYLVIKGVNSFAWGNKPDMFVTLNEDIILDAVVPEPLNNRGHLGLAKADLKNVLSWMVGVYLSYWYCTISFLK
jgi:hypothetical protein